MPEHGRVKIDLQRGASVAEFSAFLIDLEAAYIALLSLTRERELKRLLRRVPLSLYMLIETLGPDALFMRDGEIGHPSRASVYPPDQLEITRISIQSPGWVELLGALNPLQQLREYLKDRHERRKDMDWRSASEKERAKLENEALRIQIERDRIGVIGDFNALLERMDIPSDERSQIIWDRVGPPLMRLGHHQDTGLLGKQSDIADFDENDNSKS